ncbi:retinol dehydrogenase 12 [Lophiotrema nucula]|uniref:Retinol dehydrogenase 12 n=1 Tax=Lophiotrema nucula TaxID=690887 RepID=A0A6A5YTA5_9PLEO|nr:retinol dehydrogenase 12 [Lophiotrema nucula]
MATNKSWNGQTGALEVASAYSDSIKGKTALVTGTSIGGIGDAIVRALAHGGASTIVLTGRSDDKLSAYYEAVSKDYPNTKFRPLKLDLNSLVGTQKSAEEILDDASIPQIDILITNAGFNTFAPDKRYTAEGIESHFGSNHLAHFHFVNTLLPKLQAAAKKNAPGQTRVVVLSSAAQKTSPIRFSDINLDKKHVDLPKEEQPDYLIHTMMKMPIPEAYEASIAYGQSKTANTLHALQLNKLYNKDGIYAFSNHPGIVASTGVMVDVMPKLTDEMKEAFASLGEPKTIDQGAATTIVAALDPGLKPENGVYLEDAQVGQAPEWAVDPVAAEKLWKLSEDLVKEKVGA